MEVKSPLMVGRVRNIFGKCLKELRLTRGLPQKVVSLSAGMDPSYVSGLEVGRRSPPRDRQLLRLASALNATEEELTQLKTARALTQISRATRNAGGESEPGFVRLLTVATEMSSAEISALEMFVQVLKSRHVTSAPGEKAM